MLELSWQEIGLIMVVVLIVVGPHELPHILHKLGKWTRAARLATQDILASIEASADTPSGKASHTPPNTVYDDQGKAYPAYDVSELLQDDTTKKP